MLELFALPVSAYCAKVRIALDLKGIEYREVPPPDGYGSPAYRKIAPAGSIPAIRDGSFVLHDADAIVEYLDDRYADVTLLPDDIEQRALMRSLARFHDSEYEPRVRAFFPLLGSGRNQGADAAIENLLAIHSRFEELVFSCCVLQPYLSGRQLSKADICYAPTIPMANRILQIYSAQLTLHPNIDRWLTALEAVPAVKRSLEISATALQSWIDSKIK